MRAQSEDRRQVARCAYLAAAAAARGLPVQCPRTRALARLASWFAWTLPAFSPSVQARVHT